MAAMDEDESIAIDHAERLIAIDENDRIMINPMERLIFLNHLNSPDEVNVVVPVPNGSDIFSMMNITVPRNISSTSEGWSIVINPNTSEYHYLLDVFRVSSCLCTSER